MRIGYTPSRRPRSELRSYFGELMTSPLVEGPAAPRAAAAVPPAMRKLGRDGWLGSLAQESAARAHADRAVLFAKRVQRPGSRCPPHVETVADDHALRHEEQNARFCQIWPASYWCDRLFGAERRHRPRFPHHAREATATNG